MQTVTSIEQLTPAVNRLRQSKGVIGLVPTMGALHEGHLSLVRKSHEECSATVVTIFVNPTQFGPGEDLDQYPRPIDEDLRHLESLGVDLVFLPETSEIYPAGFSTYVEPPAVAQVLEGQFRGTHFRGVTTIVLKLFHLVGADQAFFGQKDYQQALVVQHMVSDLNVPVNIRVCPIVRDDDGVALSSRNVYLDANQRESARSLYVSLREAEQLIREGETDAHFVMAQMKQTLIDGGVTGIDYAVVTDPQSLKIRDPIQLPSALLVAAHVDKTRLIDNAIVKSK